MNKNNWIPEIMYEESDDGLTSNIPFIMVPHNQEMPKVIFIFESSETGEFEPNEDGDPVPIMDMDLHQFADMLTLKEELSESEYDKVRNVLGLQPLREAAQAGKKITDNVRKNLESK
jgi:hypothetical protein|tara:strand:+ start:8606 stop:8956 length:351 start_codon:yes stop_codon:yes gene_type:complete